ncbi:hypothetical protein JCM1393_05740 [Clostridium carnis]
MEFKEVLIENYPFLKELDSEILDILLSRIFINEYKMGESIFNTRESCLGFSFILSGTIRVYRIGDYGKELSLYRLKKGDNCFNTIQCILTESEGSFFADVEENTKVAILPMDLFKKYILNNPSFLKYLFKNLYKKFENVVDGIEKITFDSIESRLINYLKTKITDSNGAKIIYTTHEKIAADIGSSREVVSRSLKSLEKKEILELGRGKIKIKNLDL